MAEPTEGTGWCFTLNHYEVGETEKLEEQNLRYLVYGQEVGKNGTPHLQGYVVFANSRTLTGVKRLIPRAHWEVQWKGTPEQAAAYCKKDQTGIVERGTIPHQGKRRDLEKLYKMVREGASDREILDAGLWNEYMRFYRAIDRVRSVTTSWRTVRPYVEWHYGEAGSGKTRLCVERAIETSPRGAVYFIKDGTQWWDGYDGRGSIVIDDFDGHWPFRDFLRLLDRYPYQGQIKGGYVKINPFDIYITCEFPPEHFWQGNELAQVRRRIDGIFIHEKFGANYRTREVAGVILDPATRKDEDA